MKKIGEILPHGTMRVVCPLLVDGHRRVLWSAKLSSNFACDPCVTDEMIGAMLLKLAREESPGHSIEINGELIASQ